MDVLFEDFKLAFEFQGEDHYNKPKVMAKDRFKLKQCPLNNRLLIPVNISQLNGEKLSILIANSIKDSIGLAEIIENDDFSVLVSKPNYIKHISNLFKVVQRLYLSKVLFHETIIWLDVRSSKYILSLSGKCPISASTDAPRYVNKLSDLTIEALYKSIPKLRKKLKTLEE